MFGVENKSWWCFFFKHCLENDIQSLEKLGSGPPRCRRVPYYNVRVLFVDMHLGTSIPSVAFFSSVLGFACSELPVNVSLLLAPPVCRGLLIRHKKIVDPLGLLPVAGGSCFSQSCIVAMEKNTCEPSLVHVVGNLIKVDDD